MRQSGLRQVELVHAPALPTLSERVRIMRILCDNCVAQNLGIPAADHPGSKAYEQCQHQGPHPWHLSLTLATVIT